MNPRIVRRKLLPLQNQPTRLDASRFLKRNYLESGYTTLRGRLLPETKREIEDRLSRRGYLQVLDLGSGHGGAIVEAEEIQPKVQAYGLSLKPPAYAWMTFIAPGKERHIRERTIVGTFEHTVIPNFFDVIQSTLGLTHALNLAAALENACNSLKPGGVFIAKRWEIDAVPQEVFRALRKNGFTINRIERREEEIPATYIKITRTSEKPANLQSFYGHQFNRVKIAAPLG